MKATQRYRRTCTPTNSARVSLSRIACSALPKGECTITHMTAAATTKTTEHVVVVGGSRSAGMRRRPWQSIAAEERGRGHAEAVGAAGHPEELEGQAPQHLGQRHGEDAEEDPRVAHADEAEQRRDHAAERRRRPRNSSIDVTPEVLTIKATA